MKHKYEGENLQPLVDLGQEQGYLTFDQLNDYLPVDVVSPRDLRLALEKFEAGEINWVTAPTRRPKPNPRRKASIVLAIPPTRSASI